MINTFGGLYENQVLRLKYLKKSFQQKRAKNIENRKAAQILTKMIDDLDAEIVILKRYIKLGNNQINN